MGFSRPEHWSGWPIPSPGDLPDPGIKPGSPALQADSWPAELPGKPDKIYLKWWNGKTYNQEYSIQQGSHLDPTEKSKSL